MYEITTDLNATQNIIPYSNFWATLATLLSATANAATIALLSNNMKTFDYSSDASTEDTLSILVLTRFIANMCMF